MRSDQVEAADHHFEGAAVVTLHHDNAFQGKAVERLKPCVGNQVRPPEERPALEEAVRGTSRFCRLREVHPAVIGNTVYVMLEFATGDAAGQNMVTAGAQAVCECLLAEAAQKPLTWLVESALSGDKRATAMAFRGARGRNASAEVVLSPKVLRGYWRADPAAMVRMLDKDA